MINLKLILGNQLMTSYNFDKSLDNNTSNNTSNNKSGLILVNDGINGKFYNFSN